MSDSTLDLATHDLQSEYNIFETYSDMVERGTFLSHCSEKFKLQKL